jgi:endo-1,4-beta-xylanase
VRISLFLFFFHLVLVNVVSAQIAAGKCKFLGNVVGSSMPGNFQTYWNQVTPENSGKWESVESTRDVMNWTALDEAYNYAKAHDFPFKEHTLVWNNQQPAWLSALSQSEIKEEVEEWIQEFSGRYPMTDFIDVVNEPLNAPASYRDALGGAGTTGFDWIIWSFEKARAYCPNAKLLLNEYNIINNSAAADQYISIINVLKERNLIDGIGVQGHFFEIGSATSSALKANLDKLTLTGLPVYISEMEIDVANDSDQRQKFETLFPLLWEHPGVSGITLWGYLQGQIWKADGYLVRTNQTERPALSWLETYVSSHPGGSSCLTTGTREEIMKLRIYPNPLENGELTIESKGRVSFLKIIDLLGRVLLTRDCRNSDVVTVRLNASPGIYLLHLQGGDKDTNERILVK